MLRVGATLIGLLIFSLSVFLRKEGTQFELEEAGECQHTPLPFADETSERSPLALKDDEDMVTPLNLTCKPESFGYSEEEAARLFPERSFPRCEDLVPNKGEVAYNQSQHSFRLTCNSKFKGKYVLGVPDRLEEFGNFAFPNTIQSYKSDDGAGVQLDTEYFFATCNPDTSSNFEYVEYHNRRNPVAHQRALESLQQTPQHILMLVLDSVSRRSFYRKLPRTLALLNSLTDHEVFDFKVHNVAGEFSADSFMPTFMGDRPFSRFVGEVLGDPHYDQAIWKHMQAHVTLT